MYKCIQKIRDKNSNIIGYILQDKFENTLKIEAKKLKNALINNQIQVVNLKLTTDNRLIDINETDVPKNKLDKALDLYLESTKNKNAIKYAFSKTKSKRVGKMVARALLLGVAATSMATTVTGCRSYPIEASAETQQHLTIQDKIDMMNNSSSIFVDVKNFTFNNKAIIWVDDTKIGEMSGRFVAIFDTIKFETDDYELISIGDQELHVMFDKWTVYDKDDNPLYQMDQQFQLVTKKYVIQDMNGNDIAYLDQNLSLVSNSAEIYDVNGNTIATIDQEPFCHDFTVNINDNCTIDHVSLTTISVNYMMQRIYEQQHSSKRN